MAESSRPSPPTEVLHVDRDAPSPDAIARAADILRASSIVAVPTETVYGLAACALDVEAVTRIFEAKGRPPENPLIVHVEGAAGAREVVASWPEAAQQLSERFWPGPLTLVLPRRDVVPAIITAGLDTVAVRAPAHPVARAVIAAVGPVAAPSANRSTGISPTTAAHVVASLGGLVPLVLDAGPTDVGIESTVLSLATRRPTILRPGVISRGALEKVIGPVDIAAPTIDDDGPRASPGTGLRHYAPSAEVILVDRGSQSALSSALAGAERPGVLVHTLEPPRGIELQRLPDEPRGYARGLYAALHALDTVCDRIVVERVPDDESWRAIADRLARASR